MDGMVWAQMVALVDKYSEVNGVNATPIPGVQCLKMQRTGERMPTIYEPSLCIILQGKKRVMLGEEVLYYAPSQYLVASVDLPVVGEVTQATAAAPYMTVQIDLQPALLSELAATMTLPAPEGARAMFVGAVDAGLGDAVYRLLQLLARPQDIAVMAPLLMREVHYRLLQGAEGHAVAQLVVKGSQLQRIAPVIGALKTGFAQPMRIEQLAQQANMSVSTFHAHFKAVTAMSPLQYQKKLRLLEARRLMLAEAATAADAAYRVGYESSTQFSREYARFFGAPPARDVSRLRAA